MKKKGNVAMNLLFQNYSNNKKQMDKTLKENLLTADNPCHYL